MRCTMTIRYSPSPLRPPVAWLVPGSSATTWLDEICQWRVPLESLTLYPVPTSADDRTAAGALVTVRGAGRPAVSPRSTPYGRVAERLYLPVDALFWPPVTDTELAELLGSSLEGAVWHPVVGLVGFEAGDGLPVSALLAWPAPWDTDWGHARPGIAVNSRLKSVEPDRELTIETIMDEGRGDIGSQALQLPQQPAAPGEAPRSSLAGLGSQAISAAAQAGKWLVNQLPKTASSETWADRLGKWLNGVAQSAKARANHESERARELRRLLHMLATDPDQGLKFALPFGGGAHRGQAPASGQLARRDVNFDLSHLGGGAPADSWDVPPQIQFNLIHEYRRLAERELHLGRHRRAAYIFAELLNDLAAAAGALATGGHYREAAVLYRDRLKQPHEAAKCLEQGGLWSEALRLYEELQEFEKAGDLARRLDQPDDAVKYYRLELERIRSRGDYLAGAKLLEHKLHVPDEALELLLRGWVSVHQQRQCVGETFRLFGRLGRHDAAFDQLSRCASVSDSTFLYTESAGELTEVSRTYPDEAVRAAAADTVRVLAASRMRETGGDERRLLLDAVAGLSPEDRLLSRDCRRFSEHETRPVRRKPQTDRKQVREAELVREIKLPPHVNWDVAQSTENCYFAAGFNLRTLNAVQGSWTQIEPRYRTFWSLEQRAVDAGIVLVPDPQEQHPLYLHLLGGPTLAPQLLCRGNDREPESRVIDPPWATSHTLAMARAPYGVTWAINRSAGGLALAAYNSRHRPLASRLIEIPEPLAQVVDDFRVLLQVREQRVYIAVGSLLIIAREQGDNEVVEFPGIIRGLACSVAHSRRRVAVAFDSGGQIAWDDTFRDHLESFAAYLDSPLIEFIPDGMLVVAAADRCQIFATSDHRTRLAAECRWKEGTPIGVLRTGDANEFAVCFADGRLLVYRVK